MNIKKFSVLTLTAARETVDMKVLAGSIAGRKTALQASIMKS